MRTLCKFEYARYCRGILHPSVMRRCRPTGRVTVQSAESVGASSSLLGAEARLGKPFEPSLLGGSARSSYGGLFRGVEYRQLSARSTAYGTHTSNKRANYHRDSSSERAPEGGLLATHHCLGTMPSFNERCISPALLPKRQVTARKHWHQRTESDGTCDGTRRGSSAAIKPEGKNRHSATWRPLPL